MSGTKHKKPGNKPTASNLPQKRAFSSPHSNHPNKKPKFTSNQGQKKVNIDAKGQVESPASQVNKKFKFDNRGGPNKQGKVGPTANSFNNNVKFNTPNRPNKQGKADLTASQVYKKTNSTASSGIVNQGKTEVKSTTDSGKQRKTRYTGSQAKNKPEVTDTIVGKKATTLIAYGKRSKTEATPSKKDVTASNQKLEVDFSKLIEPSLIKKANTPAFSKGTPKAGSVTTQDSKIEEVDTFFSESESDCSNDDDSEDESEPNLPVPRLSTVPPAEVTETPSSFSEDGSDSEDEEDEDSGTESDDGSDVKAKVRGNPNGKARIDGASNSASDSGSDSDHDDEEPSNKMSKVAQPTSTIDNKRIPAEIQTSVPQSASRDTLQKAAVAQTVTPISNDRSSQTVVADQLANTQTTVMAIALPKIPKWFSQKIRKILESRNCPEAVPYQAIQRLTHYRAWLEQLRHRRWQRYTVAGHNRYELTKLLMKLRDEGNMAAFEHRFKQHGVWKKEGLRAMKKLEKVVKGIKLLDDTLEVIFGYERGIYENALNQKKLLV